MKKYICIRENVLKGRRYKVNELADFQDLPSKHFVEYSLSAPKTAEDILDDRLREKGIEIKKEWGFQQKQHVLAKSEEVKEEEVSREKMLQDLKDAGYPDPHPNIGIAKLKERWEELIEKKPKAVVKES